MQNLDLAPNNKSLVIVAHPDDETIWLGGTMLHFPKIKWTIFSLCRCYDPDRQPKFLKVCQFYQAQALISDLEDEGMMTIKQSIPEIDKRIIKVIKNKKFDYIFTHGPNGEYGHPRHIGAHQAVKELVEKKKIKAKEIYFFSYKTNRRGKISNNLSIAKYQLNLTSKEWLQKKAVIYRLYGFSKKSFEYKSCTSLETFDKINLQHFS